MPQWYKVAVTEIYTTVTNIEADSEQDALQQAEDASVEGRLEWDSCERDVAVVS